MSITLAGSEGRAKLTSGGNFLPLLESTLKLMNRIFSVALVYCDKMSTVASLGTKGEIKRQQIKFSDRELGRRILKQMDSHTLYGIFRCSFI